eukprot:5158924-Prymnesium_polylepis.1
MRLPSLAVSSSVQQLQPSGDWDAARAALQSAHVNAVVLREPSLAAWPGSSWLDAVREDVQASVQWSEASGLESCAKQRVAEALGLLWRDDGGAGQAASLAPIFCTLADHFGRCLSERSLLEEGAATRLRIRCAVQTSARDYGCSERLFHRDHLPLRLVSTLHGEGTVVLPDEALVSSREWREACRMYDHDEALALAIEEHGHEAAIDHVRYSPYYPVPRRIDPVAAHNARVRRGGSL